MQYGKVAGIDKPISRLAQGTVVLNTRELDKGFAFLDDVFALGCTVFDTAQSYGGGESERTIGRWMQARGNRDKVVIITKAAHPSQDRKRVTPFDISADLHDSLARLKTDYIDLYLLHRDDPTLPVGPLVEVLNEHHRAGKIRVFGGSNWTYQRVQEANEYAAAHGLVPFTISSPNFSLAEQFKPPWPECLTISGPQNADAREWYIGNGMPLFTWSSLAGGFFSGRFTRDNLNTFDNAFDKVCVEAYCYEPNFKRLDRVRQLAQDKGLTMPQIATAYVMSQPLNIFAIVGSATGAEYKQNMEASDLRLSPEEIAWLELKTDALGVAI